MHPQTQFVLSRNEVRVTQASAHRMIVGGRRGDDHARVLANNLHHNVRNDHLGDLQNNLAEILAFQKKSIAFGGALYRERVPHHRRELAVGDPG